MPAVTILVIDDDASLLYSIRKSLGNDERRVVAANSAADGLRLFKTERPGAVLLDLRLSEAWGLDVLRELRGLDSRVPVVIFTAFSTTASSIEASQCGAFDYLLKPVDLERLTATLERALAASEATRVQTSDLSAETFEPGADVTIIGSCPAMQDVYKKIGRISDSGENVLILGESGTGKELVARAVHQHSKRRNGQFVAINCAALSETLLESELFGHERGAFTGADRRRIGKFEYASGGTIFLDEVGDMSAPTQAKVLRLLQEQRFERLGSNDTIATDVRIVAATNKNLEALVDQGKFRVDLYYRLHVLSLTLPPLRSRREDLPSLVQYFIGRFKGEFGKDRVQVDADAMRLLHSYSWPGNMRELQSVIKHALAHAHGTLISSEHLPPTIAPSAHRAGAFRISENLERGPLHDFARQLLAKGERDIYDQATGLLDQIILPLVLDHTRGNLQLACELLGLSRNTLKGKMREHGISVEHTIIAKDGRVALAAKR